MKERFGSIRTKLLATITIVLSISILTAMVGFYLFEKEALVKDATEKVTELNSIIRIGLKYQMLTRNLEMTQGIIDELKSNKNVLNTYIINAEGVVKFSSDSAIKEKKFNQTDEGCNLCHKSGKLSERIDNLTFLTKNASGIPIIKNVTPIYNEPACNKCHPKKRQVLGLMFLDYSFEEANKFLISVSLRLFATGLITFIAISIAIMAITNVWIHKPINKMLEGVNAVKKGDYKKNIEITDNTEFKALANSFNEMSLSILKNIKEIKNKTFELTVLYTIIKKISETIFIEELKIIVIDMISEVIECDRCIVFTPTIEPDMSEMIEKEKGKEALKTVIKFSEIENNAEEIDKKIKESIIKWVAAEVDEPEISQDSLSVYLPLTIREHRLGFIIAAKNSGNAFDEEDFRLLTVIKEHLAVAFENARLYTMAITDELTHLFTLRHFQAQMEIEISRYMRYGQKFSILMLDIDNFKKVNDTYGHPAGDFVLKEISAVIKENLRDIDVPCRYGGEEFAIILPETSRNGGMMVAERIRENIQNKVAEYNNNLKLSVTISIGGASCPKNGIEIRDIVTSADNALYTAKQTGKNKVVWS